MKKARPEPLKGKPKCPECRFRVRGPNHDQGFHHKSGGMQPRATRFRRR